MNKGKLILVLVSSALYVTGCGISSAQKGQASKTPEPSPTVRPPVAPGFKTIINSNIRPANTSSESNSGGPPSANGQMDRDSVRSERKERVNVDPSATPPPMTFQKAPENSEFGALMENDGTVVERRIFKGHAQLRSAEIRWADPQTRSLKVTLKNGKIIERKGVGIINLRTVTSDELLNIIGIRPNAQ